LKRHAPHLRAFQASQTLNQAETAATRTQIGELAQSRWRTAHGMNTRVSRAMALRQLLLRAARSTWLLRVSVLSPALLLFASSVASVVGAASPIATEFRVDLDPTAQGTYGLTYPGTFIFELPAGSSGLSAQYRHNAADAWTTLPTKIATDAFNGVAAARFDFAANRAYLSVPFSQATNSIFMRVVNSLGQAVTTGYVGIPAFYDNRRAAVTVSLDDVTPENVPSFTTTVSLLAAKGLHHTVGIETGFMNASSWATVQQWLQGGYTEAAAHTRTHPCTDTQYLNSGGHAAQVSGSRDDILANLSLQAPYVPAFLQPCGFESTQVRQAVVAAHYLADRNTDTEITNYAPWSNDGAYASVGQTYNTDLWPNGGGSAALRDQANAAFNQAYSSGGIYHLMDHPWKELWQGGSFMDEHAQHVAGRPDVWYVTFGGLYQYHYLQERGKVTITAVSGIVFTPTPTLSPTPTLTRTPTATSTPSAYRSAVAADNPVAYWRLDETGGATATDLQSAHHGSYVSSPALGQPGAIENDPDPGVGFNGSSQYVSVPYSPALNTAIFSAEAWAHPTGGSGAYRGVLASRSYPQGWVLYASASNVWEFWLNSGAGIVSVSGGPVALNAWTHLAATFDGSVARLYVNGALAGSAAVTSYNPQTSAALAIGQSEPGAGFWFPGRLDEPAVYNTALSASRVQIHFQAGAAAPMSTPTVTPTAPATPTRTSTLVATPSPTAMTATLTLTPSATATPTGATPLPSSTATAGPTPTLTPMPVASQTSTATPSPITMATSAPTTTLTLTPSATATPTGATPLPSSTATAGLIPTVTLPPVASLTPTATPSRSATATSVPTATPTLAPSATATTAATRETAGPGAAAARASPVATGPTGGQIEPAAPLPPGSSRLSPQPR